MEPWELAARERIRDSLARYNWSGDSLRLGELAESFCEDGELQLRGEQPVRGHYGRYRDTFVPVGEEWLIQHRLVSTDWATTDSTMAARP